MGNLAIQKIVIALSVNGIGMLGMVGGGVGLFLFLPRLELIKWLRDASPANLDSKSLIGLDKLLEGLESCDNHLEYLVNILSTAKSRYARHNTLRACVGGACSW